MCTVSGCVGGRLHNACVPTVAAVIAGSAVALLNSFVRLSGGLNGPATVGVVFAILRIVRAQRLEPQVSDLCLADVLIDVGLVVEVDLERTETGVRGMQELVHHIDDR